MELSRLQLASLPLIPICASYLILFLPSQAQAFLGERVAHVPATEIQSVILQTSDGSERYSVRESKSGAVSVKEYISKIGIVFAVTWRGNRTPELNALLGIYAAEYEQTHLESVRTLGMRHQETISPRLVVQKWGHMRNLQGRAYLPKLLPEGVKPNEIH